MITEEQTKLLLDQLGISLDTLGQDKIEKLIKLAEKVEDPSQVNSSTIIELQKLLGINKLPKGINIPKKQKINIENKKIGRNDPCPCNSGKKWKKCCNLIF